MSEPLHANVFQLARWAAEQVRDHPGSSARELYQRFLPQFSRFATDGTSGSALISQHLRAFEADGLVVGERGKGKTAPVKWVWLGPRPESAAAPAAAITVPQPTPPDTASDTAVSPVVADERCYGSDGADPPEPPAPSPDTSPDLDDWDRLALAFAQQCRQQAAAPHRIADLDAKLCVLDGLSRILAADVCEALAQIADDLRAVGGTAP